MVRDPLATFSGLEETFTRQDRDKYADSPSAIHAETSDNRIITGYGQFLVDLYAIGQVETATFWLLTGVKVSTPLVSVDVVLSPSPIDNTTEQNSNAVTKAHDRLTLRTAEALQNELQIYKSKGGVARGLKARSQDEPDLQLISAITFQRD